MRKHVFYENPIPFRGVLHKNMGYRSNNLAVLDDRTSAHSLDDPSCDREKLRVCDLQYDSPVDIIILKIDIRDLHIIYFRFIANGTNDLRRSFFNFLF